MNTQKAVIAALLGVGLLSTPALAQAPNLGPDWELVGSRKVKTWVPHPTKPGDGKWELVDFNTYRIFQENLKNDRPDMPAPPAPQIERGPVKQGKSYEEKGEIERVRKGLLIHKYQTIYTVTPQTQTETTIHKGWKLTEFIRQEERSRALRTKYGLYDITFKVPVTNYRWDLIETGRTSRELTLEPIRVSRVVELLPPERTSEVSSLAKAEANRPTVFRGDSASKGKAALSASQLRQQMGANQVKASDLALTPEELEEARRLAEEQARQAAEEERRRQEQAAEERQKQGESNQAPEQEEEAGLSLAKVVGQWVSAGGKSHVTIAQVGNSNTMKIDTKIVLSRETYQKTINSVAFTKSWQVQIGKDRLNRKIYLKGTFDDTGKKLNVSVWRDGVFDKELGEGTFTKK